MHRKETIRFRGRKYPVLRRMTVGGKTYLILEKLSTSERQRWRAFDQHAGPEGDMRTIWVIPRSKSSRQHLDVLKRLSQNSPAMPAILEYHQEQNSFAIIMPWVWGQDLRSFLKRARKGRVRWPGTVETFNLFRRLAHALRSLHQHSNMVHGDLKPENLILCREPNRLVMIDFGSAWTVENTARRQPGDGQTDPYASPEQHSGRPQVDFRSDMFSASVVAYEMLTGEVPYAKMGGRAGLEEHRATFAETLTAPSQACRDPRPLPPRAWKRIDRVIMTGLNLDANSRYATDGVWLDELDDIDTQLNRRRRLSPSSRALQSLLGLVPESWRKKWLR